MAWLVALNPWLVALDGAWLVVCIAGRVHGWSRMAGRAGMTWLVARRARVETAALTCGSRAWTKSGMWSLYLRAWREQQWRLGAVESRVGGGVVWFRM
eukprot:413028-Prymnesium_polylepis.1